MEYNQKKFGKYMTKYQKDLINRHAGWSAKRDLRLYRELDVSRVSDIGFFERQVLRDLAGCQTAESYKYLTLLLFAVLTFGAATATLGCIKYDKPVKEDKQIKEKPNHPPAIKVNDSIKGVAGKPVNIGLEYSDPDGNITNCEIDFGDGSKADCLSKEATHVYKEPGINDQRGSIKYQVKVAVADDKGAVNETSFIADIEHPDKVNDSDRDGRSDWFEKCVAHTDPNVKDEVYAILTIQGQPKEGYPNKRYCDYAANLLINHYKVHDENIVILGGKDFNKKNWLEKFDTFSKKMKKNDVLILQFSGHGGPDGTALHYGVVLNQSIFLENWLSYKELDDLLKSTNGIKIIIIDSCFGGGAIQYMNDKNIVLMSQADKDQMAGGGYGTVLKEFFEGLNSTEADKDGNSYISVREALEYAKKKIEPGWIEFNKTEGVWQHHPLRPQIYDPNNLSYSLYLGEYEIR